MKLKYCILLVLVLVLLCLPGMADAQCSICTKTAQQLGERPAKALNAGILYLAFMPIAIFSYLTWKWWRSNR